ncbi:indolethylamine N-methyltransferase-like [Ixodes scapularis]|uniref:indolethylamine N-methyltransferase-like n=1 Tax=Ixodes scapularis TaxID=6945 RepID=UPI001A9D45F8|nr:indolethylamine N-methyltransferase-like [Ixodes scapularis]
MAEDSSAVWTDVMSQTQQEAVREAYERKFQPRSYVEQHRGAILLTFQQIELHRIFSSDLEQGKTLLDVGSGPTVNFVLSASSRYKDIVLSDLVQANRIELEKWLSGRESAVNCEFYAKIVAALEGCSDVESRVCELAERTRAVVRKVIPCDVLKPGVLPEEHRESFDAVLSCNCLETAAQDHASYRRLVCNVAGLVKPGGLLIWAGVGGLAMYPVADEEFPMADVTEQVLKEALTDAALRVEVYRTKMYDGDDEEARRKRFGFVIAARKT